MLNISEIKNKIYAMEEFNDIGGTGPRLSLPVLYRRGATLYCVFMNYGASFGDIPEGYAFCDMETGECSYMDSSEAMKYMGMPEEIFLESLDYEAVPFGPVADPGDADKLFDKAVKGGKIDKKAYETYMATVFTLAVAEGRKFYFWFFKEFF